MGALKITLDERLDAFVEEQVRSGAYPDADAVVRVALGRMAEDDTAREARFHALIQEGLDDLAAGRSEVVDDLGAWMDKVWPDPAE